MRDELYVQAIWDEEAGVYISESNIPGMFIQTETLGLFEEVMLDVVPDLIEANILKPAREAKAQAKQPEKVGFIFKGVSERRLSVNINA